VERTDDFREENADIVSFRDVISFDVDVQESDRELMRENSNGEEVSYHPPRYEYSYDFHAQIRVNHPYFDEITFQLNRDSIDLEIVERRPGFGGTRAGFDPMLYPEYRQFHGKCEELKELFRAGMQGTVLSGFAPAAQPVMQAVPAPQPVPASTGPKFCPNCGAPADGDKFCQSCGSRL